MWASWAVTLAEGLERSLPGHRVRPGLFDVLGYEPTTGRVTPGGRLAATPMARIRSDVADHLVVRLGLSPGAAALVLAEAWRAPDPVTSARPVADLRDLLGTLRASGRRIGVATSDDRDPTLQTLAGLGIGDLVDAVVCADDGVPVKPAGDAVLAICATVGIGPLRTAVVGDSRADLAMGRAAGVARVYGVRTGVSESADLDGLADAVFDSVAELRPGAG